MTIDETTGSKNLKVQLISQRAFDELSDDRKLFYLDLIKKGQVKISDGHTGASGKKSEDKKPQGPREEGRGPFTWLRDKKVRVVLNNGEVLEGQLTDVWQYEIALVVPGGSPVLILKHAVMTVQECV